MSINTVFLIFGGVSLLCAVSALVYSLKIYKKTDRAKRIFSSLNLYTIGIFISALLVFIPVYYTDYPLYDSYGYIRPLLLAIHNTVRMFILDGEFDIIRDATAELEEWLRVTFSLYAAILYVVAPVLTFGNVLSMFKNLKGEARFYFWKKRPFYIMSELNVCSVAMAESIINTADERKEKPIIVFTDVFEQNEEDDYELLLKVRDLNAICMKKDISHLNISKKKGKVEIFVIGETESENIEQAIKLTEAHKTRQNVSIYVFATTAGAGYVIDSLDKGKYTLDSKFEKRVTDDPRGLLYGDAWKNNRIDVDGGFYLRRINCVDSLALHTISDKETVTAVREAAKADKTVSVLIIGMGSYGKQFFKTALWFYQLDGYKLEINIFDADTDGNDSVKKHLEQECPELISKNPCSEDGEANYDIRFFSGIDCFSSDFDKCFDSSESGARLKRTNLAFVMLGDDDKNIEASVMLRKLFDRKKHLGNGDVKKASVNEMPIIYAVVYDDQKASNLSGHGSTLKNHKDNSYNIRFIGDRASQYSYKNILENKDIEHDAFLYHTDWLRKTAQLRHCYETDPEFKKKVDANRADTNPIYWGDEYMFYKGADGNLDFYGAVNIKEILDISKQYVNYEYYRHSSIAKAMHKESTDEYYLSAEGHNDVCTCEVCENRRKTEHMRWNAYMRTLGYVEGKRNDRGKTHPDLCSWYDLPYLERFKD